MYVSDETSPLIPILRYNRFALCVRSDFPFVLTRNKERKGKYIRMEKVKKGKGALFVLT